MKLPDNKTPIAYFCAEFAIDSNMPTYAGGLGVLAGDVMLQAAEDNFPLVGIGLLYEGKRFIQEIDENGWQHENPSLFHKVNTQCLRPVEALGKPLLIDCNFGGETIHIGSYQQRLGDNTTLYLLTTNIDGNPDYWRRLMDAEYYGDEEAQLRHQLILGIGGTKLLEKLKIKPRLYHFNEGRPIFVYWELLSHYLKTKDLESAKSLAKEQIIYTNHTLVAAGNITYDQSLVRKYADSYISSNNLQIDPWELIEPGINQENRFSITQYALNTSKIASAVSKLHGRLSKKDYPQHNWETITNAVYMGRWQAPGFKLANLTPRDMWDEHKKRKRDLEREVLERTGIGYDPERLVIGWARRISDYKQIGLLFSDITHLSNIVKTQDREVQLLIAGKAHPGDDGAKKVIQEVINHMKGELSGNAIFVHNYDLDLAFKLLSGCDVWLNTPEYGKEASGTSGMKAISNGVLNFTVADGWAAEINWDGVGWVIDHKKDVNELYDTLEKEIIPLYHKRDEDGLPLEWIQMMDRSIKLAPKFSTERLLKEYSKKLYK